MTEVREKTWLQRGRISPRDVLTAYRETEFTPRRLRYFEIRPNGEVTACGLTAVATSTCSVSDFSGQAIEGALRTLGFSHDYFVGFLDGFDNDDFIGIGEDVEEERKGWRDGRRAARFVFGEGA